MLELIGKSCEYDRCASAHLLERRQICPELTVQASALGFRLLFSQLLHTAMSVIHEHSPYLSSQFKSNAPPSATNADRTTLTMVTSITLGFLMANVLSIFYLPFPD